VDREALRQRLLLSYREETHERLNTLSALFLQAQNDGANAELIAAIFREVHSIKGAARAVGIRHVERVTHEWESQLAECREGALPLSAELIELSLSICQALSQSLNEDDLDTSDCEHFIQALSNLGETADIKAPMAKTAAAAVASMIPSNTVRVDSQQLAGLLYQTENLRQIRLKHHAHVNEQQNYLNQLQHLRGAQKQFDLRQQALLQQLSELPDTLRAQLQYKLHEYLQFGHQLQQQIEPLTKALRQQQVAAKQIDQALFAVEDSMNHELEALLLIPAHHLQDGVSDNMNALAQSLGKRVQVKTNIAQFTLDKRVLDQLRPLVMHLLRNAIDHGIELPAQRQQQNKPERGTLTLELEQVSADRMALTITDDGRGIDHEAVVQRGVKLGLIAAEHSEELTQQQVYELLFHDGLSTSQLITEVSGRGVGMAVVQEALERLGGQLTIHSNVGAGTEFRMVIPTRLSAFRALILAVGDNDYGLPAHFVLQCIRSDSDALQSIENRPALRWQGKLVPVWDLAALLNQPVATIHAHDKLTLVIVQLREQVCALLVNKIASDEELILKAPSTRLQHLFGVLGIAQRGNGGLIPVLQLAELLHRARDQSTQLQVQDEQEQVNEQQHLLVADDSFTSRGLLQSILEAAGYRVTTANDGSEAWRILKQQRFDLLVSDMEMPGMSGFTLTEKVRRDPALHNLPVVLVTALQSAEDQQRGLEAGAHAYLVKSSFEQDSLLDAIRRLI